MFLDLGDEFGDGELYGLGAVEPVLGGAAAHAEDVHQCADDVVLIEYEGVAGIQPRGAVFLLEGLTECGGFALFFDELLQFGDL